KRRQHDPLGRRKARNARTIASHQCSPRPLCSLKLPRDEIAGTRECDDRDTHEFRLSRVREPHPVRQPEEDKGQRTLLKTAGPQLSAERRKEIFAHDFGEQTLEQNGRWRVTGYLDGGYGLWDWTGITGKAISAQRGRREVVWRRIVAVTPLTLHR